MLQFTTAATAFMLILNPTQSQTLAPGIPQEVPDDHVGTKSWKIDASSTAGDLGAQSNPWNAIRFRLKDWRALPDDWDGEGAVPFAVATIDAATHFIAKLQEAGIRAPKYQIAGDGEIEFSWVGPGGYASASFLADSHIVAYSRPPGSSVAIEVDEPYHANGDYSELLKSLRSFA
jgi:hypothetical protein